MCEKTEEIFGEFLASGQGMVGNDNVQPGMHVDSQRSHELVKQLAQMLDAIDAIRG